MIEIQGSPSYEPRHVHFDVETKEYFESLSKPKKSKQIWVTSFGPKLFWGNQDTMWPMSPATLRARPTQRLIQLATAKKTFQKGNKVNVPQFDYSCGRSSQIWSVTPDATECSERVKKLATPKPLASHFVEARYHTDYSCGRVSPIWDVSPAAKKCTDRPRTTELSQPKHPHPLYVSSKEVPTSIPRLALYGRFPDRVAELATHKTRSAGPFIDSRLPEASIWRASEGARAATASPRVLELAKYKTPAEGFVSNRETKWPVSRAARRATASARTAELATPVNRPSTDHVQYNPEAFNVKPLALKAICTPRVAELATPISR